MNLQKCFHALWKWAWLVVVATALAGAVSYWSSARTAPSYQSTTTVRVGQFLEKPDPLGSDIATSQALAQSYAQAARRQPILQATIDALGLNWDWQSMANNVNAAAVGTQFLQITVLDTNPHRARAIADEIAHQIILQSPTAQQQEERARRGDFVNRQLDSLQSRIQNAERKIEDLQAQLPQQSSATALKDTQDQIAALQLQITSWQATYSGMLAYTTNRPTNYLTVFEPASVPRQPVSPNIPRNVVLAALIGFIMAAGAALVMEYLDDTVESEEDAERVLGLAVLGSIGRMRRPIRASERLITLANPDSPVTEAFRVLRTNILSMTVSSRTNTLLVTSALMAEGKTTVACNLAVAMAQAGHQVILVDADLRRPDVHTFFNVGNHSGLSSLLLDDSLSLDGALERTAVPGLRVLPSGPLPPNPAELLASERMKRRLNQMRESVQVVIIDSPPLLPLADASVLGALCDELIFVMRAGHSRVVALRRAKAAFDRAGLRILGGVMNDVASTSQYYSRYYSAPRAGSQNGRRSAKKPPRWVGEDSAAIGRLPRYGESTLPDGPD